MKQMLSILSHLQERKKLLAPEMAKSYNPKAVEAS
jgi:hypothetical protein